MFNHALPDLPHSPSVWISTLRCSQQVKLGKGGITDPLVLMNDEESKFKSLQEDKLWVTNDPMKAKMLAPTTVIGKLTRQLDSKGDLKQPDKLLGNFPLTIGASGNSKKYDPPKPG